MLSELRIGGLSRLSSCDWLGELVATVFCQGCGWRCAYCHNAGLQPACEGSIAWSEVHAFLASRVGLLDGVVFSGGEPLLQSSLIAAVTEVRALGFKVGLHTSGAVPSRLAAVLPDIDWVGFDIKAPFVDYPRITGSPSSGADAEMALRDLLASGKPREIRTTVHPRLISGDALVRLGHDLVGFGISQWVLQPYRVFPGATLNPENYDPAVVAALEALPLAIIWR
jgi:pyruvate formate lyase activating enzyme